MYNIKPSKVRSFLPESVKDLAALEAIQLWLPVFHSLIFDTYNKSNTDDKYCSPGHSQTINIIKYINKIEYKLNIFLDYGFVFVQGKYLYCS